MIISLVHFGDQHLEASMLSEAIAPNVRLGDANVLASAKALSVEGMALSAVFAQLNVDTSKLRI